MARNISNDLAKPVMQRMAAYLKDNKVTQTEVAREVLGGTPEYMNNRLTCKLPMTVSEYVAICDYLKVSYWEFMKGDKCEKCGRPVDEWDIAASAEGTHLLCANCYREYADWRRKADRDFFKKGEE